MLVNNRCTGGNSSWVYQIREMKRLLIFLFFSTACSNWLFFITNTRVHLYFLFHRSAETLLFLSVICRGVISAQKALMPNTQTLPLKSFAPTCWQGHRFCFNIWGTHMKQGVLSKEILSLKWFPTFWWIFVYNFLHFLHHFRVEMSFCQHKRTVVLTCVRLEGHVLNNEKELSPASPSPEMYAHAW